MTAEPTKAVEPMDDPDRGCWHAIGDLAMAQLAALVPQVPLALQGGVSPALMPSTEIVVSRAA